MKVLNSIAAIGLVSLVAACAQQEEAPVMVSPEPVFDKFGAGSCTAGHVYVPGTVPEEAKCVPEDECEPTYDADGTVIDCLPEPEREPVRGIDETSGTDSSSDGGRDSGSGRDDTGARPGAGRG